MFFERNVSSTLLGSGQLIQTTSTRITSTTILLVAWSCLWGRGLFCFAQHLLDLEIEQGCLSWRAQLVMWLPTTREGNVGDLCVEDVEGAIVMEGQTVDSIVSSLEKLDDRALENSRNRIIQMRDSNQWPSVSMRLAELIH